MAVSSRLAALLTAAAQFVAACGSEYSDPIRVATSENDSCRRWQTATDCAADAANGCSFQPNVIGCHSTDPTCSPGSCRSGDPFVRRVGEALWLHGKPYRFLGTVTWGIAWSQDCRIGGFETHQQALDQVFDSLVDMRVSVLKVWAFQSFAGASGSEYDRFDAVVAAARRAGIRLIFVLENHWPDCTTPTGRDDTWYASGHTLPYGSYALSYPDYVSGLVEHFRDEPTLLGWELMHEARGESFTALETFAAAMSGLIRARDANHLIALGTDNGDSPATSRAGRPSNYERLHAHPGIDLLDLHDFNQESVALPPSFSEASEVARTLSKPVFAGATAVQLNGSSPEALRQRAATVDAKIQAAFSAGFSGLLVYDYYPGWSEAGFSFDSRREDPLAGKRGVLANRAP